MSSLPERVLHHVQSQEFLRAGERVGVAVSGGIDSVALLRVLMESREDLGVVLSVVHFNHGLRGTESDGDQEFVAGLAREFGLEFYCERGDVNQVAAEQHSGVEAAARELRYGFFRRLLGVDSFPQGLKPSALVQLSGAAEAPPLQSRADQRVESDVNASNSPQGLKPGSFSQLDAMSELVPFPSHVASPSHATVGILDKIVTGHTADDQAETVLMRLIRGTGLRGLGGIYPRIVMEREDESHAEIVRLLLGVRRREMEKYLIEIGQTWREDESNTDFKFTRNRLRGRVMPLLEREFNPAIVEGLGELAEIARDEEDYWENEASGWLGTVVQWSRPEWVASRASQGLLQIQPASKSVATTVSAREHEVLRSAQDDSGVARDDSGAAQDESGLDRDDGNLSNGQVPGDAPLNASISRPWLVTEALAVQRRVIKAVGEQLEVPLEFKHVQEILHFANDDGPTGKTLSLPLGWKVVRQAEAIVFTASDPRTKDVVSNYEYPLTVPGRVHIAELGGDIEALLLPPECDLAGYNPQDLLSAKLVLEHLTVRNWRAGDRFFPAHTKAPKKVKELLQERHVTGPERRLWPVVVNGNEIVWVRGFPVPAKLRGKTGEPVVFIRETIAYRRE